ncbi:hypothetical protein PGT21_010513 [Puccinia graminis f. sp. tritici]|uniref:Uncharacterized protein n=1 Tax=Puccinia graminis f. sp. tritici TaxID=56615 RepID=A0A5B0LM92_PUCGR|nr:hypothetical protein PGT21_010513 [Puccinia graminis f. sp. tritici]
MLDHLDSSKAFASKTAASVCLDRWNDVARKIVNKRLVSPTDRFKSGPSSGGKLKHTEVLRIPVTKDINENPIASAVSGCCSFKRQSWIFTEQRESRKADGGQFGGSFDPGIGQALDFPEQKGSGWPAMCKRTLLDASCGQLHSLWIGFVYWMVDLTSKLPYRLKKQNKGGESWRCLKINLNGAYNVNMRSPGARLFKFTSIK